MQGNNAKLKTSLPLLIALALAGCGGGDSSPAAQSSTLSGTAAAGAPISGTVTVRDSNGGKERVDINADGSFSVDVSGLKAPFMLQAAGTVGDRSYTIYSAATGTGTVNITPLTDLVVANAAGGVADSVFNAAQPDFSKLTAANLDDAETILKDRLAPVLQATGAAGVDLMNGAFAANHTGLDAALDLLDVSVSGNTATITVKGDGAYITDDLGQADKEAIVPSTNLTTTANDINAIAQQFSGLSADLQSATTVDANLTKYFVQNGFMWMGQNDLAAFLGSLLQEKPQAMDNISVIGLETDSNNNQNIRAQVSFRLVTQDGREHTGRTQMSKNTNTGEWLIMGDQRIADISVNAFAESCWTNPNGVLQACGVTSGIQFYIGAENQAAAKIARAEITGLGIPKTTLTKTPDRSYLNDGFGGNMLALQDGAITGIKANSPYVITLFDNNNVELAQYTINLPKEPSLTTALDPKASFPYLTVASFNTLSAGPKGTFTLNWTLPENLRMESVVMYLADNANQSYSLDQGVSPKTTSYTFQTPITSEIMSGYGYLFARDSYGRKLALYYK